MILYLDTLITDQTLNKWPKLDKMLQEVRRGCYTYRNQTKVDIAKYTLASYSPLKWSRILIKYELENPEFTGQFDSYIKSLFPNALIYHERSANQEEYRKSIELLKNFGDEWVFYSPNNDHPYICKSDGIIEKLIEKAEEHKSKANNFVSIAYSHFPEFMNLCKNKWLPGRDFEIIDECDICYVAKFPKGHLVSISIVHIDLMERWFCGYDYGDKRIIRAEDVMNYDHPEQIVIIPKVELCRHYDGYGHTRIFLGGARSISSDMVPPLFIPDGFFAGKIKISFGYGKYRSGWVNVNPLIRKYSFQDPVSGTDLMYMVDDLPLFWKVKIALIDENKSADAKKMRRERDKKYSLLSNPLLYYPKAKVIFHRIFHRAKSLLKIIVTHLKCARRAKESGV